MLVSCKWTTPLFESLKPPPVPVEDVGLIPNTLGLPVVVPVPVPVPVVVPVPVPMPGVVLVGVVGVKVVGGVPVVGVVVVGVAVVPVPALLQVEAKWNQLISYDLHIDYIVVY